MLLNNVLYIIKPMLRICDVVCYFCGKETKYLLQCVITNCNTLHLRKKVTIKIEVQPGISTNNEVHNSECGRKISQREFKISFRDLRAPRDRSSSFFSMGIMLYANLRVRLIISNASQYFRKDANALHNYKQ